MFTLGIKDLVIIAFGAFFGRVLFDIYERTLSKLEINFICKNGLGSSKDLPTNYGGFSSLDDDDEDE